MQAYKLKGTIDAADNLVITEPVKMPPGDVEVIILPPVEMVANSTVTDSESQLFSVSGKVVVFWQLLSSLFEQSYGRFWVWA